MPENKSDRGCLAHCQRPTRCTYLFCSSSFSCRSWPISERIPRSVLERELIWLRSSCSTCLLACRSAFNFLMSCSSLGEGKEQHLHHWVGTPGALWETLAENLEGWLDGGAPRHHCNSSPQSAFEWVLRPGSPRLPTRGYLLLLLKHLWTLTGEDGDLYLSC